MEEGECLDRNFESYRVPTADEAPPIEILLIEDDPHPQGPFGAKGAGEAPIVPVAAQPNLALELWAVPTDGTGPRSLGVLPTGAGATVALRGKVLAGVDTLAVSVEPPGGSPTGKPTGPIVYAGKFSL